MILSSILAALVAVTVGGPVSLPQKPLLGTDGQLHDVTDQLARSPYTVVEFFSPSCPCQESHDARLLALYEQYRARGVQFWLIDSNDGNTAQGDAAEAARRHYPFPILLDGDGAFMKALGAKYAVYTVVLDASGRLLYRGGFDSDRHPATANAKPYLANALEAVLAGRRPNPAETKAVGCSLTRW